MRLARVGVRGVVEAELFEKRDVERVGVGMKELRPEIDCDGMPLVVDRPRIAVPADPRARFEDVHVVCAGEEVRGGDAAGARADDGDAVSLGGLGGCGQGRAGTERAQADRGALEDLPASQRRGHRRRAYGTQWATHPRADRVRS